MNNLSLALCTSVTACTLATEDITLQSRQKTAQKLPSINSIEKPKDTMVNSLEDLFDAAFTIIDKKIKEVSVKNKPEQVEVLKAFRSGLETTQQIVRADCWKVQIAALPAAATVTAFSFVLGIKAFESKPIDRVKADLYKFVQQLPEELEKLTCDNKSVQPFR